MRKWPILFMFLLAAMPLRAAEPDYLTSPRTEGLPFSEAVRHGDLLFLSGQIGHVDRKLAEGGISGQSRQAMDNIKAALARHGSSLDRVLKCTIFLEDMDHWQAFNEVYVTYFPPDRLPARSAVGVDGLALGAAVEVECIAAAGDGGA